MKIGIIADDLTGAADAVAPFAKRGYRAEVRFFQRGMKNHCETDALAIDTGSRDSPMKDTLRDLTFRRAARAVAACQPDIVFKKIDSTLRGHLRMELDAIRFVLPERLPVICPAFPANGRIIRNGELWVYGELQNRSVRAAFGYEDGNAAQNVSLAELRQGVGSLSVRLNEARNSGAACVFCDAETDVDLNILAQALLQQPADYLPVGSAGLSSAFARQFPLLSENAGEIESLLNIFKTGRVLVVVGTLHEVSRNQLRHLSERTGISPTIFDVAKIGASRDSSYHQVHQSLDAGQRFVIVTTPEASFGNVRNFWFNVHPIMIWRFQMSDKTNERPFDALFVTGGDSAKDAMMSLNGSGIRIIGEIQPGIVASRMIANKVGSQIFQDFPALLKSGGFGASNLLTTILGLE